jgi:hypothetical protein
MDWMNRGTRPGAQGHPGAAGSSSTPTAQTSKKVGLGSGLRLATVGLLFAGTILILALLAFMVTSGKNGDQSKYVDDSKMQAVFLNGGQVYFGKIKSLDDKALRMSDIYYLRVNQQVQPNGQSSNNNDISLVKLGCELHGPQDQMVINQSQVIFWENLKDDGQVAKAVAEYVKQNPNGQKCDTASADTSGAQGSTTQTQSNTTNANTNNTTTKKP